MRRTSSPKQRNTALIKRPSQEFPPPVALKDGYVLVGIGGACIGEPTLQCSRSARSDAGTGRPSESKRPLKEIQEEP
jgi:hypothetical protein